MTLPIERPAKVTPTREKTRRLLGGSGRITPREVLAAYEETGWVPVRDRWVDFVMPYGPMRACALATVAHANGNVMELPAQEAAVWDFLEARFFDDEDKALDYSNGFTSGFDQGYLPYESGQSSWVGKGFLDGAREAVRVWVARCPLSLLESHRLRPPPSRFVLVAYPTVG